MYCTTVPQSSIGVVEKWGKFVREVSPGLTFLWCACGESLAGKVSMRVQQLNVTCDTKTHDNVFAEIHVSIQYQVIPEQVYQAFYRMTDPHEQMTAYVYDVVRSSVPKISLDDVFAQKDQIAFQVRDELKEAMNEFGYTILQVLITDIRPDESVRSAMNEINAAERQRAAATDRAEGEKVMVVKAAEADAESKYLAGVGVARQRIAIIEGLRDSVVGFKESIDGAGAKDVMDLVLLTQYFDTLKELGARPKTRTVFVPFKKNDEGQSIMRDSMLEAAPVTDRKAK